MQALLALARGGGWAWPAWPPAWLAAERGRLVLWLPVLMGVGVLTYFALRAGAAALGRAGAAAAGGGRRRGGAAADRRHAVRLAALAAFALGVAAAQLATWRAAPLVVLPTHAVTLSGVVRGVDPLPAGRRLVLEAVRLDPAAPPLRRLVRVRLRTGDPIVVATGDTVRVRALLRAPAPPAYPGGWDLQRDAFFAGLGGSGFALGPAERVAAGDPAGLARRVQRLRERDRRALHRRHAGRRRHHRRDAVHRHARRHSAGGSRGVPRLGAGPPAGGRRAAYRHRHGLDDVA